MNRPSTFTTLASALALAGALAVTPAFSADEHNTVPGLTAVGAPLGLHGIDPVAFIDIGNRIDGTARYTAVHDGVAYYFSSEANLKAFKKSPARYVPQNGGFCTYGVSVGKKFDGDPRYAAVENGKLYVFLNEEIFHAFNKDRAGTIAKAERNWTKIRHTAAKEL
jgi:YHS domain-containing protein